MANRWKDRNTVEKVVEVTEEVNVEHLAQRINDLRAELEKAEELYNDLTRTPNRPE